MRRILSIFVHILECIQPVFARTLQPFLTFFPQLCFACAPLPCSSLSGILPLQLQPQFCNAQTRSLHLKALDLFLVAVAAKIQLRRQDGPFVQEHCHLQKFRKTPSAWWPNHRPFESQFQDDEILPKNLEKSCLESFLDLHFQSWRKSSHWSLKSWNSRLHFRNTF